MTTLIPKYDQGSTGAVNRAINLKLAESVSVKDFGAIGDGITDDTIAIQAALNASLTVTFPSGTYLVSALTAQGNQKISGYGATLKASTTTGKILTLPAGSSGLQTTEFTEVSGLQIVGYSSTIASGSVGIYTLGNPNLILRDVRVEYFDRGFYLGNTQFGSFYSIKAYNCNVGVYIKSDTTSGGGNSNSFYDLIALSCSVVGVLINGQLPYATGANYFKNYTGNSNCNAFAAFNSSFYIDGGAPEANSGNASSYDGLTIAGGTFYVYNSTGIFENLSDQDASSTTVINAQNYSVISLISVSGYGVSGGKYVTADSTSTVNSSSINSSVGTLPNLIGNITTSFKQASGTLYQCLDNSYLSISLPNDCSSPLTSTLTNTNGGATATTVWDSTYGLVGNVAFSSTAGNQDTNRVFLGSIANSAGFSVIGVSVYSATNTTVALGFYGYNYKQPINLLAGRWTRLYYVMANSSIPSTTGYVLYPTGTDAPTIKIAKVMIYSSSTYDAGSVQSVNSVLAGAYNSQTSANHYGRYASAVPTTGTWSVGQIVYNTAPTSGGYVGWICTTAGTPGTWKTFGAIS